MHTLIKSLYILGQNPIDFRKTPPKVSAIVAITSRGGESYLKGNVSHFFCSETVSFTVQMF